MFSGTTFTRPFSELALTVDNCGYRSAGFGQIGRFPEGSRQTFQRALGRNQFILKRKSSARRRALLVGLSRQPWAPAAA